MTEQKKLNDAIEYLDRVHRPDLADVVRGLMVESAQRIAELESKVAAYKIVREREGKSIAAEAMRLVQSSQSQVSSYERNYAIKEGARNAAAEEYFKARPQLDFLGNRRIFESGFDRGYDALQSLPAQDAKEEK